MNRKITVLGACQNNLKHIDVEIPVNKITVVTGLSGSGKSSLAFDTLHAEGQRRYIESFSAYTRQFMDRMDKPGVRKIDGILPSVAINQRNHVKTSRSTLGSLTEINDYMKQLFNLMATLFCEKCSRPVRKDSPESICDMLLAQYHKQPCVITFPLTGNPGAGATPEEIEATLRKQGFYRHYRNNAVEEISTAALSHTVYIIADRLVISGDSRKRLINSIESAMRFGRGLVSLFFPGHSAARINFSSQFHCADCDISYGKSTPNLFSFNNPLGACAACNGFGKTIDIDMDAVIPDPSLSLKEDAVKPWSTPAYREAYHELLAFCRKRNIPVNKPFKDLPQQAQDLIINESPDFYGIRGFFRWLESKTYKMHIRVLLSKYRKYRLCPECLGTHFKKEPLLYRINHKNIADIYAMSIDNAHRFFTDLHTDSNACLLLKTEIQSRLNYLKKAGLGYLCLDRQSRTLSGGEIERACLTTALGSCLVNTLYVLDEPSIGLHARDTLMLMDIIKSLRDNGNTIVIVEHDRDIINAGDLIIDMGPLSGEAAGEIVFSGTPSQLMKRQTSLTGKYLSGQCRIPVPDTRRQPLRNCSVKIESASMHNIQNLSLDIPLGLHTCITGVSGSGKSTLLHDIIYNSLSNGKTASRMCFFSGTPAPKRVVMMDQSPAGKTPRSTPATYMKIFDRIRALFAATDQAKHLGFTAGSFSFNSGTGRCSHCGGEGFNKIEMQFLADVYVECPYCAGTRFTEAVRGVSCRGRTIYDVLQMTVSQARDLFCDIPAIDQPLSVLEMVGLGYLKLGQPSTTLSGGEAQRLKIAAHIRQGLDGKTVFLFDEPTTGLHFHDVKNLLDTFSFLVEKGHSIISVEHNLDVIKNADRLIDLGPEGGEHGGRIVAAGTPEEIMKNRASHTGAFLKKYLNSPENGTPENADVRIKKPRHHTNGMIEIQGAREHNLKNISLQIPRDTFSVITGISGSGKSTLAFDIIYSESQRRFLETLSPYIRQYIHQHKRPDVDTIRGIPPAVAIEQLLSKGGRKSTVATITEIYHYLRLLFAKLAGKYCPDCGKPMTTQTAPEIVEAIGAAFRNRAVSLLAPQIRARKGFHKTVINRARRAGFQKLRIDGQVVNIKDIFAVKRFHEHTIDIITAEIDVNKAAQKTVAEEVEKALAIGSGELIVNSNGQDAFYSTRSFCAECRTSLADADPRLFSFNSPMGECKTCSGIGIIPSGDNTGQAETDTACPACGGTRLNPAARSFLLQGKNICDIASMTPDKAVDFLTSLCFSEKDKNVSVPIIAELLPRLNFLIKSGLSYITLDRSADTLSGGELQRIRIAAQAGTNLTGVLYVLDEPTIGLHPHDGKNLLSLLTELKNKGNTVIVVEHDLDTITQADFVVDLGPGGGITGGNVIASGSPETVKHHPESVTGRFLSGAVPLTPPACRGMNPDRFIRINGACEHNLKHISPVFPLSRLTVVTGVSGAGKTTLVRETLYKGLRKKLGGVKGTPGKNRGIDGGNGIRRVVEVDQSPIGKTPRSTPATYIGFYSDIRKLFSLTPEARMLGYPPSRFSFNIRGGRCETCAGQGRIKTVMSFLPDMYVDCETCSGTRFNEETLKITRNGRNIAQVLAMTIDEGCRFFEGIPKISHPLQTLQTIGLGYLRLGQPSHTLSGGEAQRIKIASELCSGSAALYILDEPTTGLHIADISKLMTVLHSLVDAGSTVVIIEHNMEVIRQADYIIDLGPGAGDSGGSIVAQGTPDYLISACRKTSLTARYLKQYLVKTQPGQAGTKTMSGSAHSW